MSTHLGPKMIRNLNEATRNEQEFDDLQKLIAFEQNLDALNGDKSQPSSIVRTKTAAG